MNIKTVFLVLLTVFAMGCGYGSKYNPMTGTGAPTIQALVPSVMPAGSPAFTLTVKGTGFSKPGYVTGFTFLRPVVHMVAV